MTERRHIKFDRLLAWAIGLGVAALACLSGNSLEVPPELWDEFAVAARLRPPEYEFPIVWQVIVSKCIDFFGINRSVFGLKVAGPVSLGAIAIMVFYLFSGYLPQVMKSDMRRVGWGRWIVRLVTIQGTLFFVLSEPVWRAGRVFSPEMLALVLSLLVLMSVLRVVERSSAVSLVLLGMISAIAAGENILALIAPLAVVLYLIYKECEPEDAKLLLTNQVVRAVAVRRMAWAMIFCWIGALVVNLSFYRANGGAELSNVGFFVGMVRYTANYFRDFAGIASLFGWLLMAAVVLIPMLIAIVRMQAVTDSERHMPISYGCFFALAGVLAFLQSTGIKECHFWRWSYNAIHSQHILCLCMFATSLTAMLSLCAFAVDIYFRNHGRLVREMYPVAPEDEPLTLRTVRSLKLSVRVLRPVMCIEPIIALVLIVPFKFDGTVREMVSMVNTVIAQTAEECGDANMLFSDGVLDAAVEVAVKGNGGHIKALSMMSGAGKYDAALRTRDVQNEESRNLLLLGASDALRTWVNEKNPCVSNIALQVGAELWRRNNLPMPKSGGLVMRTAGFPDGKADEFAKSARLLAERMLRLYDEGQPMDIAYPELNRLFLFGQWRLSRMCRMRANEAEASKDAQKSEKEHVLADRLDSLNPEWRQVQEKMDWIGKQSGMRLTPREGLKLGLERADFRLARSYARKVIATDADDVQANFALGMGYFTEKQYSRAEMHLKKCLVRAPHEPAVLNNLAIVQLRLGRYAEAETNVLHAIERLPTSSEIKTTLRHIRSAMKGER